MEQQTKKSMLRWIGRGKGFLQKNSQFHDDVEARGLYVALLTVEGCIMFDDIEEFGLMCVEFCERKQREGAPEGVDMRLLSTGHTDPN